MTQQPQYRRVEIVADLGWGDVVILFADFSGQGISSGILRHYKLMDGTPELPGKRVRIDETQRTTTHADGVVRTHWPIADFFAPWEFKRPELQNWGDPVLQKEELTWSEGYRELLKSELRKPKTNSADTLKIDVKFLPDASESVVTFTILNPSDLASFMAKVPLDVQAWQITGGSPNVVLTVSNAISPKHQVLPNAGRHY